MFLRSPNRLLYADMTESPIHPRFITVNLHFSRETFFHRTIAKLIL